MVAIIVNRRAKWLTRYKNIVNKSETSSIVGQAIPQSHAIAS